MLIQNLFAILQKKWSLLIGPPEYSLEHRIFHSFYIIAIAAAAYSVPFNYLVGLKVSAALSAGMLVILAYAYYLSRLRNKFNAGLLLSGLLVNLFLGINYLYNSGIKGPSLLLLVLTFFLLIAVSPKRQYVLWLSFNLILVLALFALEYSYPSIVVDIYPDNFSRFVDTASTYVVVIILVFVGMSSFRRHYYIEKKSVLEKTLQLESLNEEKNKLFSIISHDLKTPLYMVRQYLELLHAFDLDPKEKKEIESGLLQVTRNTQDLLSNLLAWSNKQMEGIFVDLKCLNAYTEMAKTLDSLRILAAQKQQTLIVDIDPDIDVLADKDMLQMVMRNLVSNAIKFTPNGGEIRVFTQIDNKNCIFVVRDNGVGIDSGRQVELFSLKTKSTYGTQNEKGVGLGLLLCKEYTEMQNGKIWLKSEIGQGTSFYVSLPIFVYRGLLGAKSEAAANILW